LQHPNVPTEQTCEACGEGFCAACVVSVKGQTLCGPCKNYRVQVLNTPPSPSTLAIFTLVLGLISLPFGWCLTPAPFGGGPANVVVILFAFLAIGVLISTFILGTLALRKTETNPRLQGQSLAITGMVSALVTLIFAFCWWVFASPRAW
jgi:hypothetical protein